MKTVTFRINSEVFSVKLSWLPKDSMLKEMYEGDKDAEIYPMNNSKFSRENILLVIDIITRNVERERLKPIDIDWKGMKLLFNYLCLDTYVDYIYPILLIKEDRIDWYKSCESRRCFSEDNKPIKIKLEDVDERTSDYDIIGKSTLKKISKSSFIPDVYLGKISHIPRLFVAGGYALSKFTNYITQYCDVDIFAYGSNSLKHIIEASNILLSIDDSNDDYRWNEPIRTKYSITIVKPCFKHYIKFQFILIESRTPYEILNRFDVDSCCIGFILNPSVTDSEVEDDDVKHDTITNNPIKCVRCVEYDDNKCQDCSCENCVNTDNKCQDCDECNKCESCGICVVLCTVIKCYSCLQDEKSEKYEECECSCEDCVRTDPKTEIFLGNNCQDCDKCDECDKCEDCGKCVDLYDDDDDDDNTVSDAIIIKIIKAEFLALQRFVRAFETKTNTVDPTRQSPTYIRRLIKYFNRGFGIAIPGFIKENIMLSSTLLLAMCESGEKNNIIREMKLTGLTALIVSAILKSNISASILESDYMCVAPKYIWFILEKLIKKNKPSKHIKEILPFVVSDIMNENIFEFFDCETLYTYETSIPKIQLIGNEYHNDMSGSIHQIKYSFYDGYYNI